jgi:hypothetical protein
LILLTISLAVLPTLLLDGLTSVKTGTTPGLFFEYVYGEQEEESVEEAYLKFVSEIQLQSGDSISNVTNTTTTKTQIPETANWICCCSIRICDLD